MSEADFWGNAAKAQATVAELKSVNSVLKPLEEALGVGQDLEALEELAREDESLEPELATEADRLEKLVDALELASLLSGPHDSSDALVSIHARDGGTDANDWAEMMLRMYSAWASKHDFTVELLDRQDDAVAGIQSATVAIRGPWAYGYLKGETGIHRLVRISPFNSEGKRQTSFAAVDVSPEIADDDTEVELKDEDIREDVFRASGAGGQHVNKTSSAVRLIHEPTGLVASSQEERSQLQNREKAMNRLRAMVAAKIDEEHQAELDRIAGKQATVGWGSQIRSYVLQPYQMVKDLRTEVETSSVEAVLDGDLDRFMEGYLRWRRSGDGN